MASMAMEKLYMTSNELRESERIFIEEMRQHDLRNAREAHILFLTSMLLTVVSVLLLAVLCLR